MIVSHGIYSLDGADEEDFQLKGPPYTDEDTVPSRLAECRRNANYTAAAAITLRNW